MTTRRLTLSVDFDGTIVEHRFPDIGPLKPGAKEALTQLIKHFDIVISSCRSSALFQNGAGRPDYTQKMKEFLDQNGIPYTRIDMGDEGKVVAFAYIDDRSISFMDNWNQISDKLLGMF